MAAILAIDVETPRFRAPLRPTVEQVYRRIWVISMFNLASSIYLFGIHTTRAVK